MPLLIFSRALKAIGVVGLVLALAACASAPAAGSAANGATSGGASASTTRTAGNRAGQGGGVAGDVVSVNGNTFDVQIPNQSGPYTMVQLSSNTQILKQATTTLSSVQTGTAVSATGTEENGVLTATAVRVLGQGANRQGGPQANGTPRADGTPRAGGFFQRSGNNSGQGNGGQGNGGQGNGSTTVFEGSGGSNVFGTVESVSADGLTIKAANGTATQVKLAPNAEVTVEEAGTASDIAPGVRVLVVGSQQNGVVDAARVQIVPAAQGQ